MAGTLTVRRIESVKTAGRYGDGGTLFLHVAPGGSKSWVQRLTINGRRVDRGLGGFPFVSLSEARDLAFDNRRKARKGVDPFATERRAIVPTFAEAAAQTLEANRSQWAASTCRIWLGPLRTYAFPAIGDLPVDGITRQHIIDMLRPILADKQPTARKLYKQIRAVLKWSQGAGHVTEIAADSGIGNALPALRKQNTSHHEALQPAQMPDAYSQIGDSAASASAKACGRFIVLTGVRQAEARGAQWSEIDTDARLWTIPAARMGKTKRPHVVPLSDAALAVVESMRGQSDTFVFVSPRTGRPLSDMGLGSAMRHFPTIHGCRSTFATWGHNDTDHASDVVEAALAHTVGNAVACAYDRNENGDKRLEKRRALMTDWSRYVTGR